MSRRRQAIDAALEDFIAARQADHSPSSSYAELVQELGQLLRRGGKRLRPELCMLAYEGYGGLAVEDCLPAAISLEMLHCFLLIHDDIIDGDTQRWGGPNITGVYQDRFAVTMSAEAARRAAEAQALLAGDICLLWAQQALAEATASPVLLLRLQALQRSVTQQVIAGEAEDMALAYQNKLPSEARTLQMYSCKTSSYSVILPLQTGALLAGADPRELQTLAEIGHNIGLAYQLQDDYLGTLGDEQTTGKSASSDIREGKRNLLIVQALRTLPRRQSDELMSILDKPQKSATDITTAQDLIRISDAPASICQRIQAYSQKAQELIMQTELSLAAKQEFQATVTGLIGRAR